MPDASYVQGDFRGGEWSPFAQGNFTHPRYKSALKSCLNGIALSTGPWARRPAFQYCGNTRQGRSGRVIQFNFTDLGEYRVELTDSIARIWFGTGLVYTDTKTISAISTANPAEITLSGAVTWNTGDAIQILLTNSTDSSVAHTLVNRRFLITKIDTTHFTLVDEVTAEGLDGSTINWNAAKVTATAAKILELATPYSSGSWTKVKLVAAAQASPQGFSEAILLHPDNPPQVIATDSVVPTGTNLQGFTIADAAFQDGPYYDPPVNSQFDNGATITVSSNGLTPTLTVSDETAVGPSGFVSTDVGRHMRLFFEPALWDAATNYSAGTYVKYQGAYYLGQGTPGTGNIPPNTPTDWLPIADSVVSSWAWCTITSVTSSTEVVVQIQPSTDIGTAFGDSYYDVTDVFTWRMGIYSDTTGWPSAGCYFQGRLWLTGSIGNRIDGSMSNQLFIFSPTAYLAGIVGDANAIDLTFDADNTNTFFWLQPTSAGIICGSKNGEWLLSAPSAGGITPTNAAGKKVTSVGCANILPTDTPLTTLLVHKYQRDMYEYFPDVFSGRITAPNLNELARHLTTSGIEEIGYQSNLEPIVWARTGDGNLVGCTYRRTSSYGSQPPDYAGFHPHVLGGNHTVESLTVGPTPDGTLDALYLVELDADTSVRHVTMSRPMLDENTSLLNGWWVDDGIVPYGAKSSTSGLTLYGLSNHGTATVSVQIGGLDCGDFTVSNGTVFVPWQSDPGKELTLAYLQSLDSDDWSSDMSVTIDGTSTVFPAAVGFTYTSQGQLLRPIAPQDAGTANGPALGKTRRAHYYSVLFAGAINGTVSIGTSGTLRPIALSTVQEGPVQVDTKTLYSGLYANTLEDDSSYDSMIAWQITRPVPCIIAALGWFGHGQDR
jgi:hypothetical protein